MSIADLKTDIIHQIIEINDIRIIEEIQRLLEFELDKGAFKLTDAQRKRLEEAEVDDVISEEQANSEIEEWLLGK